MFWTFLNGALKLLLAGAAAIYAGLIITALRTQESREWRRFNWADPACSAERLLVWLGVVTVRTVSRGLRNALNVLEDTSADLGEWILHHR